MKTLNSSMSQQPLVVKYVQPQRNGIQAQVLSRNAIGFVVRGKKYFYNGDQRQEANKGDVFYLGKGCHYLEDVPEGNMKPFEQTIFYYNTEDLNKILNHLRVAYRLNVNNSHSCDNCRNQSYVVYPGWEVIKTFFASAGQYLREGFFEENPTAEALMLTELVYIILANEDCCLKSKILKDIDFVTAGFEQIIQKHIFDDIPIEELARECNQSLTSFKKEFKKHFYESPHKWFVRQRLMHSRLLLISTGKSVSEIGNECNFPNTSHFIKLFKKEYGTTPIGYRNEHLRQAGGEKKREVAAKTI